MGEGGVDAKDENRSQDLQRVPRQSIDFSGVRLAGLSTLGSY